MYYVMLVLYWYLVSIGTDDDQRLYRKKKKLVGIFYIDRNFFFIKRPKSFPCLIADLHQVFSFHLAGDNFLEEIPPLRHWHISPNV